MSTPFSVSVALRYLRPKRNFVLVITILSILGVTIGVGVPFLVMSIMNGFEQRIHKMFLDFDPNIVVMPQTGAEESFDWEKVVKRIEADPDVIAVSPFVEGQVLIQKNESPAVPLLRAYYADDPFEMARLEGWLIAGEIDLRDDNILVSRSVADRIGVLIDDIVTVYSPGNIERVLEQQKKESQRKTETGGGEDETEEEDEGITEFDLGMELKVVGVINSLYGSEFVVVPVHAGIELFELDNVQGLGVATRNPMRVAEIQERLEASLPPECYVSNWMEKNAVRFQAVRLERLMVTALLCFILVVGSFCIIITILTVTMQKRPEIGLMKAIGAKTGQIMAVFLLQGLVVGVIGTIAGFLCGGFLIRYRNVGRDVLDRVFNIPILPEEVYGITELPAVIDSGQIVILAICSLILCLMGSAFPAFFVARMDAAKALRNT